MIKPEITLQPAVMSYDEAIENWKATNPVYQTCLEQLFNQFPIAKQEIKQLYLLLTDAIYINDGLLFDYCLSKALHKFKLLSDSKGEIKAYDGFSTCLLETAEFALDSCQIVAPNADTWSIKDGKNFRDWLDEKPVRVELLGLWELEVFNSLNFSTNKII